MSSGDTETTISSTPKRIKYPSVWLDNLPLDICTKIASLLPRHLINHDYRLQHIPDKVSLASVSPIQAISVSTSQRYKLSIEHVNNIHHATELIRRWTDVLHLIREVHLPVSVPDTYRFRKLLSLPTITKAIIPNYPYLIRALQTGASLRSLELRLTFSSHENGEEGISTDISQLLAECPIENLSIICSSWNIPHPACFAECTLILEKMKKKSNSLRSLHLNCPNCPSERMQSLIRVPSFLPKLEEFRLENQVPVDLCNIDRQLIPILTEESFESYKGLRRVGIVNYGCVTTFTPLGTKLMALGSVVKVSTRDVMALSTCTNLRSLDIILEEGAETAFPRNLCNLREVSLAWTIAFLPSLNERYYAPSSAFLTGLAQRNKNISKLCLNNIMITSPTLEQLLSKTGDRLRELFIPIFHQDESPGSRFSRLARCILRYNARLVELEVCPTSFGRLARTPVVLEHESGSCDAETCAMCDLRRRIGGAARVLGRRVMGFRDDGIRRLEYNLEPWR